MSIDGAIGIATSSLANINRHLALVSQNVANATTPGYAREVAQQQSMSAGGEGMGVRSLPARREVDAALYGSLLNQNATVAGLTARQTALQAIDSVQGTPGQGTDLPSLVGKLQDQFTSLAADPANQTQQRAVITAAGTLADGINRLSGAVGDQRQTAQDAIVADVGSLNASLATIGSLTDQIMQLKSAGQSSADLENQRDTAVQSLSSLIDVKVLGQDSGDIILVTGGGLSLPIRSANPFSVASATIGPNAYYPGGGLPGIMLGGADVTAQVTGGRLGANVTLRDTTLPTYQAELDEFAQNLAGRFDAQGLRLFSDPSGNVPSGGGSPAQAGYVGFAETIQVNPSVEANAALVRDGTQAVAGGPTAASAFTPNPSGGPAGFTTLTTRILDYAFGTEAQSGVSQPASRVAGLGPGGTLAAPYAAPATLSALATVMVAAQAQDSAATTTAVGTETALQSTVQAKLSTASGVSIDTEMSDMVQLQNAYGANARIISAAQAMWTQLLNAVQ